MTQRRIKADVFRGPYDPGGQPETRTGQPLELALFAWNVQSGLSASKAVLTDPERYRDYWQWHTASKLLCEAERIGFDHQVPYGMWSGYGGESGWNDQGLDFATVAAAGSAITERLGMFSTVHVTYRYHPLHIAKMGACIDFISNGRWGLNIVAGSNPADYLKFGYREVPSGDDRYAIADEFTTLMKYLWANEDPVDFEGEHFQCYGGYVAPKSVRQPRPVLMNAGQSERGFDFACRNVDWMFIAPKHGTIEEYEEYADKAHRLAASYRRKVRLAAMCYAVIEDTDHQAEQTIDWLQDNADIDAIRTYVRAMFGTSVQYEGSLDDDDDPYSGFGRDVFMKVCLGMAAYQLTGGPDTVVEKIKRIHQAGIEMLAIGFLDPVKGLERMEREIIPRLKRLGIRH